jgi:hypothetical protein
MKNSYHNTIQISVLAASAAHNALQSLQVGDGRFNVASSVAIAQCKFGSALASEPVMRLLAMSVISIGIENLPTVSQHVQDKNALIAAVEATKHDLASSVAQSLRQSLSKQSSQNDKISHKPRPDAGPREAASNPAASGGLGYRHVFVSLLVAAIGGGLTNSFCDRYSFTNT